MVFKIVKILHKKVSVEGLKQLLIRFMLNKLYNKRILSRGLLTFYNENNSVHTLVIKSFMSEFLINIFTNANFVKIMLIILILI